MEVCKQCGAMNSSGNKTCQTCGAPLKELSTSDQPSQDRAVYVPAKDETTLWLVLNIVCALCCCHVLGIIGAVYAGLAKTSYRHGNYRDAEHKVEVSKKLFYIGVILGGILSAIITMWRLNS